MARMDPRPLMAIVDWESALLDVQEHVRSKNSHGRRELIDVIADAIQRHRIPEGLIEQAMRLYGAELTEMAERLLQNQGPTSGEGVPSEHMSHGSPRRVTQCPEGGQRNGTEHYARS